MVEQAHGTLPLAGGQSGKYQNASNASVNLQESL